MRRLLLLLVAAVALAAPASAGATVTPSRDANAVATALSAPAATAARTASSFTTIPPNGNPTAVSNGALGGFPTSGSSFAVLSSGDALEADPAKTAGDDDDGGAPAGRPDVFDLTTLKLDLTVPAGVSCAVFSFRFYTDEAPGGDTFNDGFIAELDTSDWTATSGAVSAPHNFAFDAAGHVISVNSPGSTGLTSEQATGTGYEFATTRLTAATPIAPGKHSLFFSVFDQGDPSLDSAVFLDDLDLQQRPVATCARGAQDERAVALTALVLGKTVVAGVVSGTVRIKGRNGRFRTLRGDEAIPLGSTIDATKGRVRLTSAAGPGGKTQTADFYQGMFVVTQTRGSKPVTQLALSGKLSCGKSKASASARKKVRRLWGDGKGRFRTKGKYGAATVRGTNWLTEDRCGSTLVRVKRGRVAVRDFAKRKTVLVKKGKSYLARPKKR
jgi:hypothetical protein